MELAFIKGVTGLFFEFKGLGSYFLIAGLAELFSIFGAAVSSFLMLIMVGDSFTFSTLDSLLVAFSLSLVALGDPCLVFNMDFP